ncbi:hypothetical protein I7I50_02911 [Histoplasma capsulatum G186AR]|uniref:Uncharacterized protein n=1 Tax=Ajellomyces capsulatus TaxID=5037 RepID=A0A8H8D7M5_AJECA|nr:hypothetical protein I7I52_00423 [Histoplasma capsulatum]QSS71896.1 hypothetical protein I7I50_02911 [Histoplasma capsulatum G186AR]
MYFLYLYLCIVSNRCIYSSIDTSNLVLATRHRHRHRHRHSDTSLCTSALPSVGLLCLSTSSSASKASTHKKQSPRRAVSSSSPSPNYASLHLCIATTPLRPLPPPLLSRCFPA